MKNIYVITNLFLFACSGAGNTVETFNENGEKVVIAENTKAELALVDIGRACKEEGYVVISRGGSIQMSEGTRIVAKCGRDKNVSKSDMKDVKGTKHSLLNWL